MKKKFSRPVQRGLRSFFQKSILITGMVLWTLLYLWWRPAGIDAESRFLNQDLRDLFLTAGPSFENQPWEEKIWVSGGAWMVAKSPSLKSQKRLDEPDEFSEFMGEMPPADSEENFPREVTGFFRLLMPEQDSEPVILAGWNPRGELAGFYQWPALQDGRGGAPSREARAHILSRVRGSAPGEDHPTMWETNLIERLQNATELYRKVKPQLAARLS